MAKEHDCAGMLVVLWTGLGDVITSLPAVRALRERYPAARVALMGAAPLAALLRDTVAFGDFAPLDMRLLTGNRDRLPEEDRRRLAGFLRDGGFDLVVSFPSSAALGASAREAGARYLEFSNVADPPVEAVERALELARLAGADTADRIPRIVVGEAARRRADRFLREHDLAGRPAAGLHPGGSHAGKRWPASSFAAAGNAIARRYGARIVLFEGPADRDAAEEVRAGLDAAPVDVRGVDLAELAALLARTAFLLCNDSGPMHLAAAVGTPVVAIFGHSDPLNWGPCGDRHEIVRRAVPCGPCPPETARACPTAECVRGVTVDDVLAGVEALVRRRPGCFPA
ncbi:MAG: glycosyltransferase family 9 protein [Planctomycetes bacterium]|jgi:ADP-heptose:LPS heptosyltransferase|nr:glycosyltransferase family 9 protein [Planctomycetota bacterium]